MTITENELYWILKLDDIRTVLEGSSVVLVFIWFISAGLCIGSWVSLNTNGLFTKKMCFCITAFMLFVALLSVSAITTGTLLPSTKQMAMIKVIPIIGNSEIAQQLPKDASELYKLGIESAKEYLKGKNEATK